MSGARAQPEMTDESGQVQRTLKRRRLVALGLTRALVLTALLIALYYLAPFETFTKVPTALAFTVALLILGAAATWQVRAVLVSPNPAIRAIEGVAATVPLFLLLFAATYYVLSRSHPDWFSVRGLTRTDTLYFAMTVFSTVGFGDITATGQPTRLLVTLQMALDLIVLGLGVRVFVGAVRLGRARQNPGSRPVEPRD